MPSFRPPFLAFALLILTRVAVGQGIPAMVPPPVPDYAAFAAYAAGACGAPAYGTLGPACCDCPGRCGADIWADFCQEKLLRSMRCDSIARQQRGICGPGRRGVVRRCPPVCTQSPAGCAVAISAAGGVEEGLTAPAPIVAPSKK